MRRTLAGGIAGHETASVMMRFRVIGRGLRRVEIQSFREGKWTCTHVHKRRAIEYNLVVHLLYNRRLHACLGRGTKSDTRTVVWLR